MPLITNLVSYWKLDESSGNAADSHGPNTLTNTNTTAYAAAKLNNGADFEAGSSQSLSIADASQTGLDFTTALSFSLWFKLESAPGTQMNFINKHAGGGNEQYFLAYRTASTPNFRLSVDKTGNGTAQDILGVDTTFNTATWYHVVCTWDGATKTAKFYINGTQSGTDQVGANVDTIFNGTDAFALGVPGAEYFDGIMDEVGAWSKVLTSTEVSQLYNGGTPLPYPFAANKFLMFMNQR